MFTRMSKIALWILGIAIIIGGIVGCTFEAGIGLVIWLGGLILMWGMGVFVEMVNNIMDIKIILSKGGFNNQTSYQNIQEPIQEPIQKPIQVNNFVEDKGKWYCYRCNTENSSDNFKCINCGASSDGGIGKTNTSYNLSQITQQSEIQNNNHNNFNLSQIAQQAEIENKNKVGWFCRACGQKNSSNSQCCSSCGKYR